MEDTLRSTLIYTEMENRRSRYLKPLIGFDTVEARNPRKQFTSICNQSAKICSKSVTYLLNTR